MAFKKSALFLSLVISAIATSTSESLPVCIVGAGPAGLTIANGLESKGYSTIIFEKDAEVGGKCQEYYEGNVFHPMGALIYSNATYTETLKIIDQSGVPSYQFGYAAKPWLFDWRTGVVTLAQSSLADLYPLLKPDIDRYTQFWNANIGPHWGSIGYRNGIPQEYTVSIEQWLSTNSYSALLVYVFEQAMVPYGYGDVSETPAIYLFQYITPDVLLFFAGQHPSYLIDYHQVFVKYAESSIKGTLRTGTNITKIDRLGSLPIITYTGNGASSASQRCSKLVLAFPPVIHALEAAHLDITPGENAVFSPVGTTKYWSGAVNVATPPGAPLGAVAFEPAGQPSAIIPLFNFSSIATTWSWGKYRSTQTDQEAKQLLISTISKFNKDPNNATQLPIPITEEDVRDFKGWDYFPHYDTTQLQEGFYARFNDLQGQRNTFYASGLNGFETVEFAIRAGQDIVNTYF